MYGGEGRSGHHREYVGNHWDDWNGVSANGRQFKNAFTQEVRDLSGAEYWKSRKANNPSECDLENHFNANGSANINAYKDPESKPKRQLKKKSAFQQADLAGNHLDRLEQMSIELDREYERGEINAQQWTMARKQLDKRLERAWKRVAEANSWTDSEEPLENFYYNGKTNRKENVDKQEQNKLSFLHQVMNDLPDTNSFKKIFKKWLTARNATDRIITQTKTIWNRWER